MEKNEFIDYMITKYIKGGTKYFTNKIKDLEESDKLRKDVENEIKKIKQESKTYSQKRREVVSALDNYESDTISLGDYNFRYNDKTTLDTIDSLTGNKSRPSLFRSAGQLYRIYSRETRPLEQAKIKSATQLQKLLTDNKKYLIDNKHLSIFNKTYENENGIHSKIGPGDIIKFTEQEALSKTIEDFHEVPTFSKDELHDEQLHIASKKTEFKNLNTVQDRNNNINLSSKQEDNLVKCKGMYLNIAKHEQTIGKIDEALKRFGIGITEADYKNNPKLEKFRNRDKLFSKTCQALQKLKEKEINKIAKLEIKANKLYEKGNFEDIANVINSEKKLEADKQQKLLLDRQFEKKQEQLKALNIEYVKLANKKNEWDNRDRREQINLGGPVASSIIEPYQGLNGDEEKRLETLEREISEKKMEISSIESESQKLDNEISSANAYLEDKKESSELKGYFTKQPAIVKSSGKTAAQRFNDEYRVDNLPSTPLHSDKSQNNDEPVKTSEPNKDDDDFMVE